MAIVNRRFATIWSKLGVNNPPPVKTSGDLPIGYSLGSLEEFASSTLGARGGVSANLVPLFGGFGTVELAATTTGGLVLTLVNGSTAFVDQQLSIKELTAPFAFSGATIANDVVAIGTQTVDSTVRSGVNNIALTGPFISVNMDKTTHLEIFVPAGNYLVLQTPNAVIGTLTAFFTEYSEVP